MPYLTYKNTNQKILTLQVSAMLGICLFIAGCKGNDKGTMDESTNADSIIQKVDSTVLKDEKVAIGNIPFFVNEKTYNTLSAQFYAQSEIKTQYGSDRQIGDYIYRNLDAFFFHDSLYKIRINGHLINYEKYNYDMSRQYDGLLKQLKIKYGEPNSELYFPSWTEIDKGYSRKCATWNRGNKQVELLVTCHGVYYTLDIESVYEPIEGRIKLDQQMKADSAVKAGASKL
jgi:hypothetical protein